MNQKSVVGIFRANSPIPMTDEEQKHLALIHSQEGIQQGSQSTPTTKKTTPGTQKRLA